MVSGLKANKNTRDIINPYNQVIFTVLGTKEDAERNLSCKTRLSLVNGRKKPLKQEVKSTCHRGQNQRTSRSVSTIRNIRYWKTLEESYADMDDIHNVLMYFAD